MLNRKTMPFHRVIRILGVLTAVLGSDVSNGRDIPCDARPWMGRPASLVLTLPPLAGLVLQLVAPDGH